jgi:hypothetical protein
VQYTHQSVKDYVAAKKRGDRQTTDRILAEVKARYNTRTTDGSEAAELFDATLTVRFGENL